MQESRLFVAAALLLVSTQVAGESWVKIGEGEGHTITIYADSDHDRSDNTVIMRSLIDIKNGRRDPQVGNTPFFSQKGVASYDCQNKRWRWLYFSYHSGPMLSGKRLDYTLGRIGESKSVLPGTINETLWKYACRGK